MRPLVYVPVCLVLLMAGLGVYYEFFVSHDPIPQNIRSQVSFTLYYPKSLPPGWSINESSYYVDANDQVVGYNLRAPNGSMSLSIQPVPKNFNFNDFYTKRLANTVQFLTPLGQGAIGKANNQFIGSLETTSSWVLASPSSGTITQTDIQFVLGHLQVASP